MPDYQLGKIYKIVDNTNNNIYIGSTTRPTLAMRLAKHVSNFKDWKKGGKSGYLTSFKVIENQSYDIVLIENCPCDNKDELRARERHYIELLECVNKNIPGRTIKEFHKKYREENLEKIKQNKHEYYQCNKLTINQTRKEHYKCNKEIILGTNKIWRENNKEKIKQRNKEYREVNKEKIKAQKTKVCNCECGKTYTLSNKSQHEKTQFHQNFINSQQLK